MNMIAPTRRNGEWPDDAIRIEGGSLTLESIGLAVPLSDVYADTMSDPG